MFAYQMALTNDGIAHSMWGDHACAGKSTLKEISPTTYLFYMANILSETAKLQGNEAEYEYYKMQAENIKAAFNAHFYNEEKGCYCERSQDVFLLNAQVLPYAMGITDEKQGKRLKENVTRRATHLDGGIFAIKHLFPVLTEMGLGERLYDWVNAKTVPSWGYWLSFGDESLWEQWDVHTRSRNHHMFGTVDEWLYKTLAGLEVRDHKTLRIKPLVTDQLEWASAHTQMPGGKASCCWEKQENELLLALEIPFNTTATVYIPKKQGMHVYESGKTVENQNDIQLIKDGNTETILKIGSGKYIFHVK